MQFFNEPVSSITKKICIGELSCRDVVSQSLENIKKREQDIHAFISIQPEKSLQRAQQLDKLPVEEKKKKSLLGIPIAVKDNLCTRDGLTSCASKMLSNFVPPYNAAVIDAVENAGAVIVGKTNLDEFAMGSTTESSVFGMTRNPNNLEYIPGGSSGGSAAAVSAGFVPLALGSDTGGSVRQPASHCGVVGLKPTYGRVSRYGLIAFASSLDQIGPFAQDARDAGLLLSVISGADERDTTCSGTPFVSESGLYDENLKGLTIGVPKEYFGKGLSDPVRGAVENLIEKLNAAGVKCINVSMPNIKFALAAYYILCTAEASSNLARYDGVKYGFRSEHEESLISMYKKTRQEGFGPEVKRRIMLGTYVLSSGYYDAYFLKAAKIRTLITRDFETVFQSCDAVISPVSATAAFKLGEMCDDPLQMYLTDIYTVTANLAGIPGISVPCGKDDNLPVGAQFMAPKWREDTLLKLAHAAQAMINDG